MSTYSPKGLSLISPFQTTEYGGYINFDALPEEEKRKLRLQALNSSGIMSNPTPNYSKGQEFDISNALSGLSGMSGGSDSGVIGGALGGAATGATIGSAVPGIGTLIGAGAGALIGGIGAGIEGGKKDEQEKANLELLKQAQATRDRSVGLDSLRLLAEMRSNAIANRRKTLFKNDLARLANGGL